MPGLRGGQRPMLWVHPRTISGIPTSVPQQTHQHFKTAPCRFLIIWSQQSFALNRIISISGNMPQIINTALAFESSPFFTFINWASTSPCFQIESRNQKFFQYAFYDDITHRDLDISTSWKSQRWDQIRAKSTRHIFSYFLDVKGCVIEAILHSDYFTMKILNDESFLI